MHWCRRFRHISKQRQILQALNLQLWNLGCFDAWLITAEPRSWLYISCGLSISCTRSLSNFSCFHRYGDIAPKTILGRIFAVIWTLVGIVVTALIVGSLANALASTSVTPVTTTVVVNTKGKVISKQLSFLYKLWLNSRKGRYRKKKKELRGLQLLNLSSSTDIWTINKNDVSSKSRLSLRPWSNDQTLFVKHLNFVLPSDMF